MNYHGKRFRSVSNTPNGTVSGETIFEYRQEGNIVSAFYSGGGVLYGHLIAIADEAGNLEMRYHHVNDAQQLQTGICYSRPELLPDGRIRMHEQWQWTSGDKSRGASIIEEC